MAQVLGAALSWGKTIHSYTDTDYAKQKSTEAMTGLVMLYALKNAVGGHVATSVGSMVVATILWMNHEAIIKQNLANTAVVFSTQVDHLNEYIDRQEKALQTMAEKIESLVALQVNSEKVLGQQYDQLSALRTEKEALSEQINGLSILRDQLQKQVEAIETAQELFNTHMAAENKRLAVENERLEKKRTDLQALKQELKYK